MVRRRDVGRHNAGTLVFGTDHEIVRTECITNTNDLTFEKARDVERTDEATQADLSAMDSPVHPTQVQSDTPQTDRLGTQPDVNAVF